MNYLRIEHTYYKVPSTKLDFYLYLTCTETETLKSYIFTRQRFVEFILFYFLIFQWNYRYKLNNIVFAATIDLIYYFKYTSKSEIFVIENYYIIY